MRLTIVRPRFTSTPAFTNTRELKDAAHKDSFTFTSTTTFTSTNATGVPPDYEISASASLDAGAHIWYNFNLEEGAETLWRHANMGSDQPARRCRRMSLLSSRRAGIAFSERRPSSSRLLPIAPGQKAEAEVR
ncbi:MAG: hypothetical protein AB1714_28540 [Acidobacteriota bacterium]